MLVNRYLFILLFVILRTLLFSQSISRYAFASGANSTYSSGSLSLESNIGEMAFNTYSSSSNILTQGFIQNDPLFVGFPFLNSPESIKIYPNPIVSNLTIELGFSDNSDVILEVVNVLGEKQVFQVKYTLVNGKIVYDLNFDSISFGIYLLKITSVKNQINETLKLIKT